MVESRIFQRKCYIFFCSDKLTKMSSIFSWLSKEVVAKKKKKEKGKYLIAWIGKDSLWKPISTKKQSSNFSPLGQSCSFWQNSFIFQSNIISWWTLHRRDPETSFIFKSLHTSSTAPKLWAVLQTSQRIFSWYSVERDLCTPSRVRG